MLTEIIDIFWVAIKGQRKLVSFWNNLREKAIVALTKIIIFNITEQSPIISLWFDVMWYTNVMMWCMYLVYLKTFKNMMQYIKHFILVKKFLKIWIWTCCDVTLMLW